MLFDSNVWLALTFSSHPHHALAKKFFSRSSKEKPVFFCRATQQSFLRLSTTPVIIQTYGAQGFTNLDAGKIVVAILHMPNVQMLTEPPDLEALWLSIAGLSTASPKVWMDAYLAAFCILHKIEFVTFDKDFRNFENHGLKHTILS